MTATIPDIRTALSERLFPTIALWNRLEGRPHTTQYDRALRAEVRDPLWMLARQWQVGEFQGTDAGSPVTATYHVRTAPPTRYRASDAAPGALPGLPLEAVVEGRPVPFTIGPDQISFDLRVALGRHFMKLLSGPPPLRDKLLARWPIALPDPTSDAAAPLVAHPDVWATMQALAGRVMDGYELYAHIKAGGHPYDGIDKVPPPQKATLDALAPKLVAWFEGLIAQPAANAFDPVRLEHRFAVGVPDSGETVLSAAEYPGGGLDWHSFTAGGPALGTTGSGGAVVRTALPGPVRYRGMPNRRWWTFEDGTTDFGAVTADTTDLVRLLFTEFALIGADEWLILPCDLTEGAFAVVDGVMVTDTFGRRFWIERAGSRPQDGWQHWSMFDVGAPGLFLPPVAPEVQHGPAVEDALLVRDENANMVWGIERTVWTAAGTPLPGTEAARETLAFRTRLARPAPPAAPIADVAYEVMTTVPENWIPFLPMHVPGDSREIQLQRGAMLRTLNGAAPVKVRPRTTLLRPGLDQTPAQPHILHEEEVQRTGTRLSLAFKRTRRADGSVVVWLGVERATGRGEASSGLAWDVLSPSRPLSP